MTWKNECYFVWYLSYAYKCLSHKIISALSHGCTGCKAVSNGPCHMCGWRHHPQLEIIQFTWINPHCVFQSHAQTAELIAASEVRRDTHICASVKMTAKAGIYLLFLCMFILPATYNTSPLISNNIRRFPQQQILRHPHHHTGEITAMYVCLLYNGHMVILF